ncbi:MAG: hypothetical protein CVU64_22735 [Deltaproteobacteria bacterium HGW-Deltaproteobacteria-21]|nr:MAG: hypothetical protein CVU64_22735 [Deltaproteobacteria bacterium HGW-Deltaproteobacteria-21]
MVFEPNRWAPVPDAPDVEIYPLILRPSVTCSNSFILKTNWYVIIIDPGGSAEQAEHIRRVVFSIPRDMLRPIFIFFTHCHIDHYLNVNHLTSEDVGGRIICHSEAARAIETRDDTITLANMNSSVLPVCKSHARLFETIGEDCLSEVHPLKLINRSIPLQSGDSIQVQSFPVSSDVTIDAYHTPGHSPDGITYRVGSLLITGDLHLAITPGIAGKAGWDNRQLAVSLQAVIEIGRKEGAVLVCPGHGKPLPFSKAESIFESARKDAERLTGVALFNRARSQYLAEYGVVLLEEASRIFSIIAARLLKVSYYLALLEEQEKASAILESIDLDIIDETVAEFQTYVDELKGARGAPLIAKAVQFSKKVTRIFEPEKIADLFDPHFHHRIKSLLSDFVNVVYGIRYKDQESLFDLREAVTETIDSITRSRHEKNWIFETIEDNAEFVNELSRMIACTPLFSSMRLEFDPVFEHSPVIADRAMFQDLLSALLEQLAIADVACVRLQTGRDETQTFLSVTPGQSSRDFGLSQSKTLYLQHSMRLAGGEFHRIRSADGSEIYRYSFDNR